MQLADIQSRFKDLMLAHPDALHTPDSDFAALFDTGGVSLQSRLKVYRNNIVGSLTDVMVASFPVLKTLVGTEFLEGMARSFILKHPPRQGCLNFYGHGFDDFIAQFEPAKALAYLPDIAALEIAMNDSYYAKDQLAFTAADLATINANNLADIQFEFCDHVRWVQSSFPILDIRNFCLHDDGTGQLNIHGAGQNVLVFRNNFDVELVPIEDDQLQMFLLIGDGLRLGNALEKTLETHQDFDIQQFLNIGITYDIFKTH